MEVKTKSTLYIVGSLIIGILIGSITTISILSPKKRSSVDFRKKGSYQERMFEIIEPTDSQKEDLKIVLKKYEAKMMNNHNLAMEKYRTMADSMNVELGQYLTDDQKNKLEKYQKERRERYQRKKQRNTDTRD